MKSFYGWTQIKARIVINENLNVFRQVNERLAVIIYEEATTIAVILRILNFSSLRQMNFNLIA